MAETPARTWGVAGMNQDPELERLATEVHDVLGDEVLQKAVMDAMSVVTNAEIKSIASGADAAQFRQGWLTSFIDAIKPELRRLLTRH